MSPTFPSGGIFAHQAGRSPPTPLFLQACVRQCQGKSPNGPIWTPCSAAVAGNSWPLGPAAPAQPGVPSAETQHLKRMPRVRSLFQGPESPQPGPDAEQKQLQKRFGGFTGARKSARKLASQKRFSEFMRQYLVLSLRSQRRRTLRQRGHP